MLKIKLVPTDRQTDTHTCSLSISSDLHLQYVQRGSKVGLQTAGKAKQ